MTSVLTVKMNDHFGNHSCFEEKNVPIGFSHFAKVEKFVPNLVTLFGLFPFPGCFLSSASLNSLDEIEISL